MEPTQLEPVFESRPLEGPIVLEPLPDGECAAPGETATADESNADAAEFAVVVEPASPTTFGPRPGIFRRIGRGIASACGWVFGSVTLIGGLAVLASIPIVQFLSLGYLLESAGRIGRTGRFRDAFPGVRLASRLGGMALGTWLVTMPWRLVRVLLIDAELIDPSSPQTLWVRRLLLLLTVLTPIHLALALSRGGRLRYFFAPLNVVWFVGRLWQGGYFGDAWRSSVAIVRELRPWHYFSLGLRGYVGALAWLVIPSTLYAIGTSEKTALLGLLGGVLMMVVVMYVPFLQVHFAVENRFRAMFELGKVRARFRYSPIFFLISFLFTLVLVLPLYLLKVEVVPRDALWLPALVFIVTIFPLKVLAGWAYGRSLRREAAGKRTWLVTRLGCRLLMLPVAFIYAFVVFFTQYTGWHGVQGLYEHHAFLLPVPF